MERLQHSFDTFALLRAAMKGDEGDVHEALQAGADVNAVDASGRTALTCAITGECFQTISASDASFMSESRLNILKILVGHQVISLYTLNAAQESLSGLCPLGMCAWLNMPTAVEALLRYSTGRISVDGTDSLGATPLMYAARDGNLAVVKLLLDHGARPDIRDINHRTPIQHALRHSESLWMCEASLRQARRCQNRKIKSAVDTQLLASANDDTLTQARIPFPLLDISSVSLFPLFSRHDTASATDQLIRTIVSSDLTGLHSLLCLAPSNSSPFLINKPDGNGWSPIHHCVAIKRPSMEAVDALYHAGADVSLFTTLEHYTPLHCLARKEHACTHSLYLFAVHLIRDLHAPLNAKDRHDDTCIHIAAEHGECIDVLIAFLDCDQTCAARNSRNSRGLTAFEVAKPRFRAAFEMDRCISRPRSSISMRTIRPSTPLPFLSPLCEPGSSKPAGEVPLSSSSVADFDVMSSSNSLMDNLGLISVELRRHTQFTQLDAIQDVHDEAKLTSHRILSHFRTQIEEARQELGDARVTFSRIDRFWSSISHAVEARLTSGPIAAGKGLLIELIRARRLTRASADSQATAVSDSSYVVLDPEPTSPKPPSIQELDTYVTVAQYKDASIATEPQLSDAMPVIDVRPGLWPEWLESLIPSPDSTTHFGNLEHAGHHIFGRPRKEGSRPPTPRKDTLRSILAGRKREEVWGQESGEATLGKSGLDAKAKNGGGSGTSRLKTWLKKKIAHDHRPLKFEVAIDIDEERCPIGREVKSADELVPLTPTKTLLDERLDASAKMLSDPILQEHLIALVAAGRDLGSIEECMETAEQFIATAYRSISRAERISQRVLQVRERAIQNLRMRYAQGLSSPETELSTFLHIPDSSCLYDYSGYPSSPPSSAVSSIYSSAQLSCASLPFTPVDTDDEDTRALRGLLLRKIETRLGGSFDEIDKVTMWLRIVREVVRGVKIRTGL